MPHEIDTDYGDFDRSMLNERQYLANYFGKQAPVTGQLADLSTIKTMMEKDPFYQAGLINLSDVKPIEADPNLTRTTAPYNLNPLKADMMSKNYGYFYPGDENIFVRDPGYATPDTAATTTHEGIHKLMDPRQKNVNWEMAMLPFNVGTGAMSALGPTNISSAYGFAGNDLAGEAAQGIRNELMARWFEDQIWGDYAPSAEFSYPVGGGYPKVNYATMMRPGQGPLGIKGLKELLAKRGMPMLKKIALRAHKNIERKYKPSKKTYVAPPRGGGADVMPIPPRRTVTPKHAPHPDRGGYEQSGGNAGGAQLSSGMTTGQHAAFRMARGGLMDIPLPGRNRDI
tara:strand:+ start:74 stop:1096 length:1023 start_codon:yes stop_codon:yes gene_type:complete